MDNLKLRKIFSLTIIGYLIAVSIGCVALFLGISIVFLFIPALWLVISCLAYFSVKQVKWIKFIIFLNVFIAGITMAAFYSSIEIDYSNILISILVFLLIVIVEYFLIFKVENKSAIMRSSTYISGVLLFFWSLRWYGGDVVLSSSITFAFVAIFCMNIAIVTYYHRNEELLVLSVLKLSSMLMFGGVFFLVIVMLSDGELFDIPIEVLNNKEEKTRKKTPFND